MKATTRSSRTEDRPSEAEIREYAHHLYVSSGWLPGRDLDNWLQAEAQLTAERKARRASRHHAHRVNHAHAEPQHSI